MFYTKSQRAWISSAIAPLFIVVALMTVGSASASSSQNGKRLSPLVKLEASYDNGEITRSERAISELKYIYDTPSFPSKYKLSASANEVMRPLKCGFGAASLANQTFGEMSPENQSLVTSFLARPSQQATYTPPGGHFLLHFDTSGTEAVPSADLDSSGVPDYIELAGTYLDSSWDYFHTTVGYLEPPSDGIQGGDGKYDIYFLAIAAFGVTIFENPGPEPWQDFTSYIQLHHTFLGFPPNLDPDGDQLGALKVTIAHEYYHAVQLAYDGSDDVWLYESGATAQEDELFFETHDNYQYFPFYWNAPDTFLTVNPGFHKYGAYVWPAFLNNVFSDTLMRKFWEYSRFSQGMDSFDSAFALFGTSTKDQFQEFARWSFFTGSRFQPGHFPDGANYPGVPLAQILPQVPFDSVVPLLPPDGLGANYVAMPTFGGPTGMLVLDFSGSSSVAWRLNVYLKDSVGGYETIELSPQSGQPNSDMKFMRYNYTNWDTVFVSPLVVSPFLNDNSYVLSASVLPHGDADASGTVNIADVTYIITYIFSQGPEPVFELLMGDADCSDRVNIADVTFLISHIFAGGPAPCEQ